MGIRIDVRIDLTPLQKRIMRASVVLGTVAAALGIGLAAAAPHQWSASDPLKAADLNSLNVVTGGDAGKSISVGATVYCGVSAAGSNGAIGSYTAAKATCETTCSTNTAHMCTADELVRSAQLGVNIATGWYASGLAPVATLGPIPPSTTLDDCDGWTVSSSASGPVWKGFASSDNCVVTHPILCCD